MHLQKYYIEFLVFSNYCFLVILHLIWLTICRPRERETRRSRSKGATAFFPDDAETFTYPVFERMQMNKKSDKPSNNQVHTNGNQVSFIKITVNFRSIFSIKNKTI